MRFAVVVLAGCDIAWGIPGAHAIDATDAPMIDAAPDSETCTTYVESVNGDAILISSTQAGVRDQGHGTEGSMNVGVGILSEGLLRYDAPPLVAGQHIRALRFVGPFATSSHICGTAPNCGPCTGIASSGTFDVEFATSAWDEVVACYNKPTSATTWQVVGALGATDRSATVGQAMYQKATDLSIELDPTLAADWIQNDRLSIILSPKAGAVTILPQDDYVTKDGTCVPNQALTKLSFTVCQ